MEKTANCPKCNYVSADEEFSLCPKCGIIIKKYYETLEARQELEAQRLKRKQEAEEEVKFKAQQQETLRAQREQEEVRRREQERQEEERKNQIRSWKKGAGGAAAAIVGVLFLLIGLSTEPGEGGTVNLHRLQIKQTLYTLGGFFFIISAINSGVDKILKALADIHSAFRKQSE